MNIRISADGSLHLERKGKETAQYCPFQPTIVNCGCWCPLFSEPTIKQFQSDYGTDVHSELSLCHKIIVGDITDERKKS